VAIDALHFTAKATTRGIGIRGLIRGMATLPQGNQELLVVTDKVGRPPGELWGKQVHGM